MRKGLIAAGGGLVLLVAGSCGETSPEEPLRTALLLFEIAAQKPRDEAMLARVFEMQDDEADRAKLGDALDALPAAAGRPEVRLVDRFDELGRVAVDLTVLLPGGSEADYTVQLQRMGESDWRVIEFHGPGVSWPPRPVPGGEGLSTRPDP
ncbi:MAG TPA: hypothetical protein VD788_04225 [Candidatus Polarisedimenticolaceae bacterium]|nr:hypothetical protein [Candidatus Polarisedimenticolaceae bacterium]